MYFYIYVDSKREVHKPTDTKCNTPVFRRQNQPVGAQCWQYSAEKYLARIFLVEQCCL